MNRYPPHHLPYAHPVVLPPAQQQPPVYPPLYAQPPASASPRQHFLTGMLVGAAAVYLLTNEEVQRTAIRTAVRAWTLVRGGVEEMKERFRDAEAELRAGQE